MSTLLLLLSSLLVFVSLLSIGKDHAESKGFVGSLLMLHFAINGVFISGDLISLFIFFEALFETDNGLLIVRETVEVE